MASRKSAYVSFGVSWALEILYKNVYLNVMNTGKIWCLKVLPFWIYQKFDLGATGTIPHPQTSEGSIDLSSRFVLSSKVYITTPL